MKGLKPYNRMFPKKVKTLITWRQQTFPSLPFLSLPSIILFNFLLPTLWILGDCYTLGKIVKLKLSSLFITINHHSSPFITTHHHSLPKSYYHCPQHYHVHHNCHATSPLPFITIHHHSSPFIKTHHLSPPSPYYHILISKKKIC